MPAGIVCGSDCSEDYASGIVVTLTATPAAGSVFTGWSKAGCSGLACSMTTDSPKTVTAIFTATEYFEDSETGDMTKFPWRTGGHNSWFIQDIEKYSGMYSAEGPILGDTEMSYLEVPLNVAGDGVVSFWLRVSSEQNDDHLRFKIDGIEVSSWSGETGWKREAYPVSGGWHTFRWEYTKGSAGTGGSDSAWLDNISLPAHEVPVYPIPDIKANYSDGPVSITRSGSLLLEVSLLAGYEDNNNADWWALADTQSGWYYYDVSAGWLPGLIVSHQGPLFNLDPYAVLNTSGLPEGSYTVYFGVDTVMNVSLEVDESYYDSVEVNVSP